MKRFTWNHKQVYRIYRELELNLRIKPKKRIVRERSEPLSVPTAINQVWSIDFMSDALANGRKLRTFNVLDDYNREGLGIEVDLSLPSARVIRSLEQIIEWRGKPTAIRCDNGPELVSETLINWTKERQITMLYIQPGKPNQDAYVERYNRTVRHEWLDMHALKSIEQAQLLAIQWLWRYNNERPNSSGGGVPPKWLLDKVASPPGKIPIKNGGISIGRKLGLRSVLKRSSMTSTFDTQKFFFTVSSFMLEKNDSAITL